MRILPFNAISVFSGASLMGLMLSATSAQFSAQSLPLTADQKEFLDHVTMVDLPDGLGGTVRTVRISALNLQIVNGFGTSATTNGLGNLIVGYNELGNPNGDNRTGSHNIVGGVKSSYSAAGGFVVGDSNTVSNQWASVSGGARNISSGPQSSVSGGDQNVASAARAWVGGGADNQATGVESAVSGGWLNVASGGNASVSGGLANEASGDRSSISGGQDNVAAGFQASILGGKANLANGNDSTVCGGQNNTTTGLRSTIGGGENLATLVDQDWAAGPISTVFLDDGAGNLVHKTSRFTGVNVQVVNGTGTTDGATNGVGNLIVGYNELGLNFYGDDRTGSHNIIGGVGNSYSSYGGSVAGNGCTIAGPLATVSGGVRNRALATQSVVVGGVGNSATFNNAVVVGGVDNTASAGASVALGGQANVASGLASVVVGGAQNSASGQNSSLGGGWLRTVTQNQGWRAGTLFEAQ